MERVISDLDRLRRRGRTMLVMQRASVVVAWVVGIVIALIAMDYLLRLPGTVRLVLLLAGVAALAYAIWSYLRSAIRFQPSLTQVALRVERVLPSVAGRLASSVEFAAAGIDRGNEMAARSVRETEARLAGESINTVIASRQTWRDVGVLAILLVAATTLSIVSPTSAATGLTRIFLPYGETRWPARTGVESLMSKVVNSGVHPRGQVLALRAHVTRGDPQQVVNAYVRMKVDGEMQPWQRFILTHQGGGVHERLVDTNAQQIELYFATDDDQTSSEVVELVPPPAVRRASLTVTPPAYAVGRVPPLQAELGQGIDDRAVTDTPSLIGSTVQLRLELNKPLPVPGVPGDSVERTTWLSRTFGWAGEEPPQFSVDTSDPSIWTLEWTLKNTHKLPLELADEYGLTNTEPIAYRIDAVEDRPPAVTITTPQADESVLPSAVVALEAQARDDVALTRVGLQAHLQRGAVSIEAAMAEKPAWDFEQTSDAATGSADTELDLASIHVSEGDVVLVTGIADDVFELQGERHETARSPVRRLRVINEMELATQLRRQLGAVRQNAIRIEALQAELQDDVIDDGVQPGIDRAQAQLGERVAAQRKSAQDIARLMRQNRLDDPQLGEILHQTQDLLDFAGRAANKAVEAIEQRQSEQKPDSKAGSQRSGTNQSSPSTPSNDKAPKSSDSKSNPQTPKASDSKANRQDSRTDQATKSPDQDAGEETPTPDSDADDFREPAEEDRAIVEAQQEVRDELADLIKLLDRDEDTWVVKRQLENLAGEQARLAAQTSQLGQQTMGQKPEDLTEKQKSDLDRAAEKQRELRDEARKLIEQLRERSKGLEKVDPQSAEAMNSAADIAEQQQLDRTMDQAAQQIQQNQMSSAGSRQQTAQGTMQKMLKDITEMKRAHAEQLMRQLASLIESIQRLITVQEHEITSLAIAKDAANFSGLDRSMIRLNQNTQSVAGEARAAGQESRRIARALDRASDTQGAAVVALRASPIDDAAALEAENRSLELLKEAKTFAEELQKQTEEEETRKRREELMEAYRKVAQQQVGVRAETLGLVGIAQLDRRQLVEARRLGSSQEAIRASLAGIRDTTSEIIDSPIFSHAHRLMDGWSLAVSDLLLNGAVNTQASDRQQQIADAIGHLIQALEESMAPPDEFAKENQEDQQGKGGDGPGGSGEQALVPRIAQLKLLQGLQEQVYNLTKDIDSRSDLDAADRRTRLREIGQQQRELHQIGQQMLEDLQQNSNRPKAQPLPEPPIEPQPEPALPDGPEPEAQPQ